MPTAKHRIAAYLPPDVNEKFQAFKQQRGVGDSQALILILTKFLEVNHQMSQSSSLDIKALRDDLIGELDIRFGELKSELHGELLKIRSTNNPLVSQEVSHEFSKQLTISQGEGFTNAQLSERFGCDAALVRKQKSKYRDEAEKFIIWSKTRDPDGRGWKFNEEVKLFNPVDG